MRVSVAARSSWNCDLCVLLSANLSTVTRSPCNTVPSSLTFILNTHIHTHSTVVVIRITMLIRHILTSIASKRASLIRYSERDSKSYLLCLSPSSEITQVLFSWFRVCVWERECVLLCCIWLCNAASHSAQNTHTNSAFQHSSMLLKAPRHCYEAKYDPNTSHTTCTGGDDDVDALQYI